MVAHRKALAISQKLVDAQPTLPRYQDDLAESHTQLGRLLARQKRFAEAFTAFNSGLAIRQKLTEADPKNTASTNNFGYSHAYRGWALFRSGQAFQAAADLRKAVESWDKAAKERTPGAETQFERSRALALLASLSGDAKSGVAKGEAAIFADQAVAALREAFNSGTGQLDELKEPDFDVLRGRADFQKLVAGLGAKVEKPSVTAPLPSAQK
jgi:tetratricopeptide (TPR) repeat protein